MRLIKNAIGWEDECGFQVGYSEEFAFLNTGRLEEFKTPILKESETNHNQEGCANKNNGRKENDK